MTLIDEGMPSENVREVKPKAKKTQAVTIRETAPAPASPLDVINRAIAQGISGDSLKQLMDLQERWESTNARKAFDIAMAQAQADMPLLAKNRLVNYESQKSPTGFVTYKHEDLAEIVETIRPVLHKYGLAHRFRTEQNADKIRVTCIITGHGHREETALESTRDTSGGKNNLQEIASTVTYLERYTLKAALGLAAAHDDDARSSEGVPTTITALQLKEINALIEEVGADAAKVCKACHVGGLEELTQAQFEKAMAKLETMRAPL